MDYSTSASRSPTRSRTRSSRLRSGSVHRRSPARNRSAADSSVRRPRCHRNPRRIALHPPAGSRARAASRRHPVDDWDDPRGRFLVAHLFDVVAYQLPQGPVTLWQVLNPFGGLSSFGGFLGALAGLFAWSHRRRFAVLPFADALAFGLAPGWMFGRLGCFTAHDHPGQLTTFFLGVRYPGGTRHDLGLYEALWAALVWVLFLALARAPRRTGTYVSLLAVLYAPLRFGLDFLRIHEGANADPRYAGLTPAQYGCSLVFAAGCALIFGMKTLEHDATPSEP